MNFLDELKNELGKSTKDVIKSFIKDELPTIFENAWDNAEQKMTNCKSNISNQIENITDKMSNLSETVTKIQGNSITSLCVVDEVRNKLDRNILNINKNIEELLKMINEINNDSNDKENVFLEINDFPMMAYFDRLLEGEMGYKILDFLKS